jgi:hypothetical protein
MKPEATSRETVFDELGRVAPRPPLEERSRDSGKPLGQLDNL